MVFGEIWEDSYIEHQKKENYFVRFKYQSPETHPKMSSD